MRDHASSIPSQSRTRHFLAFALLRLALTFAESLKEHSSELYFTGSDLLHLAKPSPVTEAERSEVSTWLRVALHFGRGFRFGATCS